MSDKPMKKLYRYIKFHLKMTYKNIVRHFGLTFSASVAVSITLILISVFMLLTNNLNSFTKHIEQQVTIRASIDTIVKDKQKQQLLHAIEQLNTVKHVTLSTGKEELENYKAEFQDDSTMFDMYEGKANPIRDTFLIEVKNGKDIQKTADKIENMKGIVSAEYGGDSTSGMISTFEKIREGGMIFIIFLIVIAVFLISNKIKMSIYTRKQEIAIMRFVGYQQLGNQISNDAGGCFHRDTGKSGSCPADNFRLSVCIYHPGRYLHEQHVRTANGISYDT